MTLEETEIQQKTGTILENRGPGRANLLPILQQIQVELGYLPSSAMLQVARFLGVPEMDVYGVATFYNQFRLTPPGRHSIKVCMGTACHVKGGSIALSAWERRLAIGPGETTEDREFDLETVACVGCCAMAPVAVVDQKVEGNADPTRVDGILLKFQLQREKEGKTQREDGDPGSSLKSNAGSMLPKE
jgi:NADH-quinone oxidoreductase subunit E